MSCLLVLLLSLSVSCVVVGALVSPVAVSRGRSPAVAFPSLLSWSPVVRRGVAAPFVRRSPAFLVFLLLFSSSRARPFPRRSSCRVGSRGLVPSFRVESVGRFLPRRGGVFGGSLVVLLLSIKGAPTWSAS